MLIPFFTFRIMVGCGLIMLALGFIGSYLSFTRRIGRYRLFLWATFLSFPLPFIATWTGWFTAEVGRQPWAVYGLLRTADAMTPFLTARAAAISLVIFALVYTFIFSFGIFYIYRLMRTGLVPADGDAGICGGAQPAAFACRRECTRACGSWRIAMVTFWVSLLALSILLYVLLDGFDLGIGILFGLTRDQTRGGTPCGRLSRRSGTVTRHGWS